MTVPPVNPGDFHRAIRGLEGRRCWAVFYGPATGGIIQLHFESKVPRAVPLKNPALSHDERFFDGEYALYISCRWHIEERGAIGFSSHDAVKRPDEMAGAVEDLVGHVVSR